MARAMYASGPSEGETMRPSKLRAIAIAMIAVFTCVAVLAPSTADARRRKRSKLTIVVEGGDFSGRVVSRKAVCVSEREVIVFERLGTEPDPTTDTEIASDTSDEDGEWNTGNTGANNGRYYAFAPAALECKALTSKTVEVTGRPDEGD
jgi:hypothetical protein